MFDDCSLKSTELITTAYGVLILLGDCAIVFASDVPSCGHRVSAASLTRAHEVRMAVRFIGCGTPGTRFTGGLQVHLRSMPKNRKGSSQSFSGVSGT